VYALNADTGRATWVSTDITPDDWTAQFLAQPIEKGTLPEYLPAVPEYAPLLPRELLQAPAPSVPLAAPQLVLLDDQTRDGRRYLRMRVTSLPRRAADLTPCRLPGVERYSQRQAYHQRRPREPPADRAYVGAALLGCPRGRRRADAGNTVVIMHNKGSGSLIWPPGHPRAVTQSETGLDDAYSIHWLYPGFNGCKPILCVLSEVQKLRPVSRARAGILLWTGPRCHMTRLTRSGRFPPSPNQPTPCVTLVPPAWETSEGQRAGWVRSTAGRSRRCWPWLSRRCHSRSIRICIPDCRTDCHRVVSLPKYR
jgi:hypothetical protein